MNRICQSILKISQNVRAALAHNRPVVALQSTIISHGMPYPQNKQCANSIQNTIRSKGVQPATIAIFDGKIHVGLNQQLINRLAQAGTTVRKVSRRDLGYVIANKQIGATTVSATMIAAHSAGIDLFVTGGIGGVHRGFQYTMDVSDDLQQLSRTRINVISAGVESILDIGKTLQYLQTKGVPVVTFKSKYFPAFFSASSGLISPFTINSQIQCAKLIFAQQQLGLQNGTLIAVPNNNPVQGEQIEKAIQKAIRQSQQQKIVGAKITPFLLKRVNQLTEGKSLKSNISVVHNNALIGAGIANQLSKLKTQSRQKLSKINIFSNISTEQRTKLKVQQKYSLNCTKPKGKIIGIGGSAIDYQLTPKQGHKFQLNKSCVGKTRKSLGGIARNVIDCSSKLGIQTVLISALGTDQQANLVKSFCQRHNIQLQAIIDNNNKQSSAKYYAILDHQNHQFLGVSEMQINQILTFNNIFNKYFKYQKQLPNDSPKKITKNDIIIIDSNVPENELKKIIQYCSEQLQCTVVFEAKGQKTKRIITSGAYEYVNLLKMNFMQKKEIQNAVKELLGQQKYQSIDINKWLSQQLGSKHPTKICKIKSIITNGPQNIELIGSNNIVSHIQVPKPKKIQKTTGAGDTFTGTYLSMLLYGLSEEQALLYARAASKLNIQSPVTQSVISQFISIQNLEKVLKQMKQKNFQI